MTDECISPLRQRMIEDMSLRHFGEKTQKDYIRAVKNLTSFLGRSPDTASNEDLRLFQPITPESQTPRRRSGAPEMRGRRPRIPDAPLQETAGRIDAAKVALPYEKPRLAQIEPQQRASDAALNMLDRRPSGISSDRFTTSGWRVH